MKFEADSQTVSVVVATLDRPDDLVRFLDSLGQQTLLPDELIVVDAGAQHPVEGLLQQKFGPTGVSTIYLRSEPGLCLQRNRALEVVSSQVVFFFDDDVILEPSYIQEVLACFGRSTDPPVGGVQGTLLAPLSRPRWKQWVYHLFCFSHEASCESAALYSNGDVRHCASPAEVIEVPALQGCRMAFLREVFESDRFIQYLPGYCRGEDVDFSYRVSRSWTLLQSPAARLEHRCSSVNRLEGGDILYQRIRARIRFFSRYGRLLGVLPFLWSLAGFCAYHALLGFLRLQFGVLRGLGRGLWDGLMDPAISD